MNESNFTTFLILREAEDKQTLTEVNLDQQQQDN